MNRSQKDPQDLARDIRDTRSDMSETVDALTDKLDPSRLKDEAVDAVSSAATEFVDHARDAFTSSARDAGSSLVDQVRDSSVLDTIKENPLPALAVGLSVAWFASKLGESEQERYRRDRYAATGDPYYAPRARRTYRDIDVETYREPYRSGYAPNPVTGDGGVQEPSLGDKASDALDTAKDKAGDLADSIKDTASDAADAVQETASGLTDRAGDRFDAGRQRAHEARRRSASWLDRQMDENPLLVGSVALAAGALVGLSLPETDAENEAFGDAAERVRSQALDAAESASEAVTSRASGVVDDAKSAAKDVADKAKKEAKDVAGTAKSEGKKVASTAKTKAKSTAKTAKEEAAPQASSSTGKTTGGAKASSTPKRSTARASSTATGKTASASTAKGTTKKTSA